jgi:hypothetical protein
VNSKNMCSKTVFASRSQLCVHAAVKQLTGHMQRVACEAAVQSKGCTYKLQGHQSGRLQQLQNIADIEDLIHVGLSKHVCLHMHGRCSMLPVLHVLLIGLRCHCLHRAAFVLCLRE